MLNVLVTNHGEIIAMIYKQIQIHWITKTTIHHYPLQEDQFIQNSLDYEKNPIQPNHQVNSNFPGNDGEFDRKQNLFEFEFEFEYVIFTEGLIYENESISYTKRVKYDTFSE